MKLDNNYGPAIHGACNSVSDSQQDSKSQAATKISENASTYHDIGIKSAAPPQSSEPHDMNHERLEAGYANLNGHKFLSDSMASEVSVSSGSPMDGGFNNEYSLSPTKTSYTSSDFDYHRYDDFYQEESKQFPPTMMKPSSALNEGSTVTEQYPQQQWSSELIWDGSDNMPNSSFVLSSPYCKGGPEFADQNFGMIKGSDCSTILQGANIWSPDSKTHSYDCLPMQNAPDTVPALHSSLHPDLGPPSSFGNASAMADSFPGCSVLDTQRNQTEDLWESFVDYSPGYNTNNKGHPPGLGIYFNRDSSRQTNMLGPEKPVRRPIIPSYPLHLNFHAQKEDFDRIMHVPKKSLHISPQTSPGKADSGRIQARSSLISPSQETRFESPLPNGYDSPYMEFSAPMLDDSYLLPTYSQHHLISHSRNRSISKMPLSRMYELMGLSNDHTKAKWREERIMGIVKTEGFDVGNQTWIRDTEESTRKRIIDSIYDQTKEYGYTPEILEIIVRRGTYARMQSKLRQKRRHNRRSSLSRQIAC